MLKKSLLLMLLMALLVPWAAKAQNHLNEGFEGTTFPPEEWTKIHVSGNNAWARSTGTGNNGSSAFAYRKDVSGGYEDYLITPLLEPQSGDELSFYLASQYSDDYAGTTLTIEVSTTTPTIAAFTTVIATYTSGSDGSFGTTGSNDWVNKTVDVSAYVGQQIYIAFHAKDIGYNADVRIDDVTGVSLYVPACPKPTNLEATLTSGNGTIATLTWTENGTSKSWVLEYGTSSDFTGATSVNVSGTPTKNLTGLTAETKHYARVKSSCDSEWSSTCEFTPTNALTLTVYDGTTTNGYIPLGSGNQDYCNHSEYIIPATDLKSMTGAIINSIKLYANYNHNVGTTTVYVREVEETTFSGTTPYGVEGSTTVYNGTLTISSTEGMKVTFNEGYEYGGGNLLIGFYKGYVGGYTSGSFFGVTVTGASIGGYGYSAPDIAQRNFIPKTTFDYLPNPYPKPKNLATSGITAHEANISWTAPNTEVQSYKYQYKEEGGDWTVLQSTTATSVPLTGLTAETHHIFQVQAIYAGNNESAFASIEFDTEIACAAPTNLAASDITADGATLSWDGSASSYNVRYRTQRGFHYDFEQAEVWTYDNFPPCTTYDGDGVQCFSFSGETYTNFPFIGSTFAFQSQGGNLSSHSGDVFGLMVCPNDASAADDWFILPAITIANGDVFQFYAREITTQYGDELISVGIYGDTEGTFATVIDDIAISETTYTLHSYDLSAYAGQTIRLAIHYYSADVFGFMFDDIFVGDPNDNTWDVTENKVTSPYPIVGLTELTTYDFEVQADCGGGETSSWVATSFTTLPSCMPVSNLAVSDITTTTVGLTWEDNNGGTASYIVTDGDDNPMTVTNLTVTGCTVTGLIANTLYTFKVSADCGSTTVSIQARTECDVITTLPYDEGFETVTYYCWALDGFSGLNNSTYAHTGNMSIFADGSSTDPHHIIVPETDDEIDGLMLNFWYYNYNAGIDCGTLYVGYVTDPDDFTTFTEVGSIDMSSGISEYAQSQDFVFTGAPAGSRMAIDYDASGENYAYVMIDDARIDIAPSCVKPYDLLVYDETTHGATFEWTSNGSETEWHLYISTDPTAPADDIPVAKVTVADSNPFTVTTGLDPETDYYVWVRANCDGSDYSAWAGPETFTTDIACPAPTGLAANNVTAHTADLSWTGTSDSYNVWYRTAATMSNPIFNETFETSSLPTGWGRSSTALTDDVLNGTTPINSYSGGWVNTSYGLGQYNWKMNIYSTGKYWLITPNITLDAKNTLNFDAAITAYNSNNAPTSSNMANANSRFVVLITTDNQATWTILREWNNTGSADVLNNISNTGNNFSIDLTAYAGETVKIAFYGGQTVSGPDCDLHIDNVVIGTPVEAGEWTKKTADASPYVATGLLAETKYEAQVQGNCGSEGLSQWTSSVFFTTDIACPAPSALTASNATSSSFDLQWINGGAEDWIVAYKVDGAAYFTEVSVNISEVTEEAGLITYTLGGLDPETDYIVKVRDNCEASIAGDGYSAWTDEVAYSTVPSCSALNPVVDPASITHHDATVNFDGESATGFKVKYREAAGIDPTKIKVDEGFEHSGNMPDDWTHIGSGSLTINTTSSRVHAGSYSLRFSGATSDNIVVLPELDVEANTLLISFWSLAENQNYSGTFQVGYVTDATDASTFQTIGNYEAKDHLSYTSVENLSLASAPNGARIAFRHTSANASYWWWIDDVVVGAPAAAGEWQIVETGTTSAYLTNLEPGTMYDVKVVPNCDNTIESATVQFTTLPDNMKYFLTAGEWGTASNWMDEEIPAITDNATIRADVTIAKNYVAYAQNITRENSATITIKDGGELYHSNAVYSATMEKEIAGATTWGTGTTASDGWYVISNPLSYNSLSPTNTTYVTNLAPTDFDLYKYQEDQVLWANYHHNTFNLTRGMGFLYARNGDETISFMSDTYYSLPVADVTPTITYTEANGEMAGWNLLGNPFSHSITWANIEATNVNTDGYFKLGFDGAWTANPSTTAEIKPMEGFLVKATAASPTLTIKNVAASSKGRANNDFLAFTVANSNYSDITYAMFSDGEGLEKINHRNADIPMAYIPQDGERYAIATMGDDTEMFNLNFKAMTTGQYTLSYKAEGSFSYLHVIDRMTGEDIDMLIEDEYTFIGSPRDDENRFIVKLRYNANGNIGANDIFAYQNGDEIIVSGEGELQIFDVLGHFVTSMRVNGSERISASTFANGVYVFRMVGNEVKTQKIVVR